MTARLAIAAKDGRLSRDLMGEAGARTDLSSPSAALFAEAEEIGLADADDLSILDVLAARPRG